MDAGDGLGGVRGWDIGMEKRAIRQGGSVLERGVGV
jgi:hypothetical protein